MLISFVIYIRTNGDVIKAISTTNTDDNNI